VVVTFDDSTSDAVIEAWADAFAAAYCADEGIVGACDAEVVVSGRRLLAKSAQIKIKTDPSQVSKVDSTAAASKAASFTSGGATPATATAASKSDSVAPTASPTPQPTVSWQSRFLFWIWLSQFLGGIGGLFGF
jgi:hypothetical protein